MTVYSIPVLTFNNTDQMCTIVNSIQCCRPTTFPMTKPINPAVIGALVREGCEAAGLTQTQLAERIGASRFWVAAFEKGKPSVELGLALMAIQALGMSIRIQPEQDASTQQASEPARRPSAGRSGEISLATIIANATLTHVAPSQVTGWPGAIPPTASRLSDD